jgi:hypothetical protein
MNWYRCDFTDGDSKFFEIDKSPDELRELVVIDALVPISRSLVLFPHKGENGKDGLAAAQLKDMNPLYLVCKEEFVNCKHIKSFGIVDVNNDAWKQIAEKALGERRILTPNKSLLLS